jgi:dienelactone hydrolase
MADPVSVSALRTLAAVGALAVLAGVAGCGGDAGTRSAATPTARSTPATVAVTPTSTFFDPDTYPRPSVARATLLARFVYDRRAALDITRGATRRQGGATIQQITYAVAGGAPIPAEIVVPDKDTGRHPGVVLAHGGAIDPDAFLAEAVSLAGKGMISILPDIPMTITGDAETDVAYVTRSVVAERRALDILIARPDVDAHRLGFVGHSWGADLAAIMAGVDPRLAAVVIACARSRIASDMFQMGSPADAPGYMRASSTLDGDRFVAVPGARTVLIQYGRLDTTIPLGERDELTKATAGQHARHDYDAGHDLVAFAPATTDRLTFLTTTLQPGLR